MLNSFFRYANISMIILYISTNFNICTAFLAKSQKALHLFSEKSFIVSPEKVHRSQIHSVQTHLISQWNYSFLRNLFILGFPGIEKEP